MQIFLFIFKDQIALHDYILLHFADAFVQIDLSAIKQEKSDTE